MSNQEKARPPGGTGAADHNVTPDESDREQITGGRARRPARPFFPYALRVPIRTTMAEGFESLAFAVVPHDTDLADSPDVWDVLQGQAGRWQRKMEAKYGDPWV